MRWGVVTFPGSNDDRDMLRVADRVLGDDAVMLWHGTTCRGRLRRPARQFSYAYYLRAARSPLRPVMGAMAQAGGWSSAS